jgi:hypothetical protein
MSDGFCDVTDVSAVLQDDFAGANPGTDEVEAAIVGQTQWIRRQTSRHFFDTSGGGTLTPSGPRSVSGIRLDVPASPHSQDRQITQGETGVRYPVSLAGPYARVRLPHYDVQALTALEVRDADGGVTDWIADPDKTSGRGGDYYLQTANDDIGDSHLYVRASSLGSRVDFTDLLTLAYEYGRDPIPDTIRRVTALRAAAELVIADEFESALPNDTPAISAQSKADEYRETAENLLEPFHEVPIA